MLRRERDIAGPTLEEFFINVVDKADRDHRIHEAVRLRHYKLREVADRFIYISRQSASLPNSKTLALENNALNIPLGFSRHGVGILPYFVVTLIPQHGPDHANHVSAKSTNGLVVGLALSTFSVVVGL